MIIAPAIEIVKPATPTAVLTAFVDSDAASADHFDAWMDSLSDAQIDAMADAAAERDAIESGEMPW